MKQSESGYRKEPFSEKLRQHATDIMVISVCLPFVFLMAKYKHTEQSAEHIQVKQQLQSDIIQNQQNVINFTDSIKNKTR